MTAHSCSDFVVYCALCKEPSATHSGICDECLRATITPVPNVRLLGEATSYVCRITVPTTKERS